MPQYNYIVCDPDGKKIKGLITADNEAGVVAQLRKQDVVIVSIEEVKAAPVPQAAPEKASVPAAPAKQKKSGKKVTTKDIVVFSRQFATMIDARVPISQAMEALVDQTINPSFRQILQAICEDIREGNSLSLSFAKYPRVFDPLYVNMLRVGETAGILDQVLEHTALYLEKSEKLRQKVQAAMIYPVVVLSIAFAITAGLIVFVVPTFSHIYDSLGQKLPAVTQVLINFSAIMRKYGLLLVFALIGLWILFLRYRKTPEGSLKVDRLLLRLPLFGDMVCKTAVSRFCHTFATLIQSGVPILEALEVVKQSCGNRVMELLAEDLKVSVREGEGIAVTLGKSPVFPKMVVRMISIGERSGHLDKMLIKVAEFFDEEMDSAMEGLTKVIEPLIISFLGIVIGFIVLALFMPIFLMTKVVH